MMNTNEAPGGDRASNEKTGTIQNQIPEFPLNRWNIFNF